MTMDIKDIIKWFLPCFHILLKLNFNKKYMVVVCLFLCFNLISSSKINSEIILSENLDNAKNVNVSLLGLDESNKNQSDGYSEERLAPERPRLLKNTSIGRTFGPRIKKMIAGLLPLIFQLGAASTWAVVAALVGVKTLLVSLVILKLLLIAGAAKIGALFASKGHQHHGWEPPHPHTHPPQKEIHLHIHNGHEHHEDVHTGHEHPITSWSREGYSTAEPKPVYVYEPYRSGPQTISTPYGNYMKIDSGPVLGPVTVS